MTIGRYKTNDIVVFIEDGKLVTGEIWLVRKGYYHTTGDAYLCDEDIVGQIVDGTKLSNPLFVEHLTKQLKFLQREIDMAIEWELGV